MRSAVPARLLPPLLALCLAAPAALGLLAGPVPPGGRLLPEVALTCDVGSRPAIDTLVIANQKDWQTAADTWGIAAPPRVDFRTHFLIARFSWSHEGPVRFVPDRGGDLYLVVRTDRQGFEWGGISVLQVTIRSFPLLDVRSVNGLPVPKR